MDHVTTTPTDDGGADRRGAAALLVAGALLLLGGNIAHPMDAAPTPLSRLEIGGDVGWMVVHLVIAAGMVAVTVGLVLLAGALRERAEPAATALAVVAVVGGTVMAAVFAALDGFAMGSLAESWQTAEVGARGDIETAALVVDAMDSGLAGFGTLLLMGIGMVALGACLVHAGVGRPWLRAAPWIVGALGTVTGLALLVDGASSTTINLLLRPTAAGMTITLLALGVTLRRAPSASGPVQAVEGRAGAPDRVRTV